MKNLAPIAVFTYNRPELLKILINSLKKNSLSKNSIIYIFSDKWKNLSDKKQVMVV
jgi:GT2 family glycosyltransferase